MRSRRGRSRPRNWLSPGGGACRATCRWTSGTALIEAKRRDVNLTVWPTTPLPELDGKSPEVAAADPAYRVRLAAVILLLELTGEQSRSPFDYNELRGQVGLAAAAGPGRGGGPIWPSCRRSNCTWCRRTS